MEGNYPEEFQDAGPRELFGHNRFRIPPVAEEVIKLSEKVLFPIKEYPKYNFAGRLLGPKGSNLKALQASLKVKISILGRGSTRDKAKEEELSKSDDPQHEHFKHPLHVLIQAKGPQIVAHRKMAAALNEINNYMVPESVPVMPEPREEMPYDSEERRPLGREIGLPPIRRGGHPPQGALLRLDEEPPRDGGRIPRVDRHAPPAHDAYVPNGFADTHYERYPETIDSSRYEYPEDKRSFRVGDKRPPPLNSYSPKRYRGDNFYLSR